MAHLGFRLRMALPVGTAGVLVILFAGAQRPDRTEIGGREGVTFTKDIAPLIFAHCASCHRPRSWAPFSLMTYQDAKPYAAVIADALTQRRMPPWMPALGHAKFEGERRLADEEIALVRRWVDEGAVEGDPADLPPAPQWSGEWELGEPDLIVTLPSYEVPSTGRDIYRNLVTPIAVSETSYVRAVEMRPGDTRVVHHARMMVDATPSSRELDAQDAPAGFDGMDLESNAGNPPGFFVGWTPGKVPKQGREDMAWPVAPGTDLVLQLHLRPSGRPELVTPQVGLYFAKRPPKRIPLLIMLGSFEIDIPPGDSAYVVTDQFELPVDVEVLSVYPHAHYLGKELQGTASRPNGRTEWLIRILDWDFNWQDDYRYAKPISLPAGTILSMRYTYDNSSGNPQNPSNPPRRVVYGSGSADEMADLILQVLPRRASDLEVLERDLAWRDQVKENDYVARQEFLSGDRLASQGRYGEAVEHFRNALAYRSDDPKIHHGLAGALIALQEFAAAVLIAERGADLVEHHDPVLVDRLAEAYAGAGRIEQALRTGRRAFELATEAGLDSLAAEIAKRVERYRGR